MRRPRARAAGLVRPAVSVLAVLALAVAGLLVVRELGLGGQADGARSALVPAAPLSAPRVLAPQGSLVRAEVRPDGRVTVTHWIRSRRTMRAITLTPAASTQVDGPGGAAELEVRTTSGELRLDDQEVGSEPRTIDLGRPSTLILLEYTLDGVVQTSDSMPGRALVGSVALDAAPDTGRREAPTGPDPRAKFRVLASDVLSLACAPPGAEPADLRPCGTPLEPGRWTVTLAGADLDDRVTAQVDLGTSAGG